MGTYSDESPDASIGERLANSFSKLAGLPSKPRREPVTGTDSSGNSRTATEATDAQASDYSDSTLAKMRNAQSTDRDNSY